MQVVHCDICDVKITPRVTTQVVTVRTDHINDKKPLNKIFGFKSLDLCYECQDKSKTKFVLESPREYQPSAYSFFETTKLMKALGTLK